MAEIKKCYNCKHAGRQFKIVGKTHLHCEHPKYTEEDMKSGRNGQMPGIHRKTTIAINKIVHFIEYLRFCLDRYVINSIFTV